MPARRSLERWPRTDTAQARAGRAARGTQPRRRCRTGVGAPGASTVEFAISLPLLAAFTIALCGVILLARDAVLAQGAAREGARAAAVSGDRSPAVTAARAALPAGRTATISVSRPDPDRVKVQIRLSLPLPYGRSVPVTAEAVAAVEPDDLPPSFQDRSLPPGVTPP